MKKLMTTLALAAGFAVMTPGSAEARDRHHHHHSHYQRSSSHHHHHYGYSGYYYRPYVSSYSYGSPVCRERVLIGYDRCGYPVYGYRSVPRYYSRSYIGGPGFHLSFGRW